MNIDTLLQDYRQTGPLRNCSEIEWFRKQPSLDKAVEFATRSVDQNGKRYGHQRRITRAAIADAQRLVMPITSQFVNCKSFDEIIELLASKLSMVQGLGELYFYDVAFRIGAKLGLLPTKVYLHAGTRAGAKFYGLNHKADFIEMKELPAALQKLKPWEVEDFLCIYKTGKLRRRSCGRRSASTC